MGSQREREARCKFWAVISLSVWVCFSRKERVDSQGEVEMAAVVGLEGKRWVAFIWDWDVLVMQYAWVSWVWSAAMKQREGFIGDDDGGDDPGNDDGRRRRPLNAVL